MPDPSQPAPNPFDRPSARAAGSMPVQRGNYGIPPRRPAPLAQPAGPRMMDIVPGQRMRPVAPIPTPVTPPPPVPASVPSQSAAMAEQISVTRPAPRPLYTNTPAPAAQPELRRQQRRILPKLRLALLVVATLLTLGGIIRWATAGSISNDLIAAGAVSANDGNSMTIQFTADDGKLHKFTDKSNSKLIPGSALQVAYRSGAADNSAKQVAPIQSAHSLGVSLFLTGVLLLAASGIVTLAMHRKPKTVHTASVAHPVTV
ncbi:MAG: hypothetical protein JWN82_366 [Candidatus Saccharibacteria bacterium]|nr:hypothetical protein [Candidatus Saccharibacteria bacterium]